MSAVSKWLLTDAEKEAFIATITPNLSVLRIKAGISQEELANLLGISRQTYSAVERTLGKCHGAPICHWFFFMTIIKKHTK